MERSPGGTAAPPRLMVWALFACTGDAEDSGSFESAARDTVAEQCSAWTGIVGLGTTWTYEAVASVVAEGTTLDAVARVTHLEGASLSTEWLRTTTTGIPEDTGDSGDSGDSASGDTTTTHETFGWACDVSDGLFLTSYEVEEFSGTSLAGSPSRSGVRTYTEPVLILPVDPTVTSSWTGSFSGTSTLAGDDADFAYTLACTATATESIAAALGTVSGVEMTCSASDGIAAHDDHGFYASNAGRVLDDVLTLATYAP